MPDLWGDPLGSGWDSQVDQDLRLVNWRDQEFLPKVRAVEDARWKLATVDYRRLADPRLVGCRAQVERLRDDMAATLAELLEALPEPEVDHEGRVARLLGQATGGR
jgi:hypothetical protein